MLLNDDEIKESMESPLNLLNRLKSQLTKATTPAVIPTIPPKADEIITDLDTRIKESTTRSKAVKILNDTMDELAARIPEIQKPERLAAIAASMSKVIEHQDSKNTGDKSTSQIIVYAPQVQSIENYQVVEVAE